MKGLKNIKRIRISGIIGWCLVLVLIILLIFTVRLKPKCPLPATITKYQCENGSVVDSINLCEQQKCPVCPTRICKKVTVPYSYNEAYLYRFDYAIISDITSGDFEYSQYAEGSLNYLSVQITKIKNLGDKKAYFTVEHHYKTLKKQGDKKVSDFIESGEIKEFKTFFDTDAIETVDVTTEVIPQQETRYRQVIKYNETEVCSCE